MPLMSDRELGTLRKQRAWNQPRKWPTSLLVYAVMPEHSVADPWVDSNWIHHRVTQLCQHIRRAAIPKRTIIIALRRMAESGAVDLEKRVTHSDNHSPDSITERSGHITYFARRRDIDFHGELVWPEWLTGTPQLTEGVQK